MAKLRFTFPRADVRCRCIPRFAVWLAFILTVACSSDTPESSRPLSLSNSLSTVDLNRGTIHPHGQGVLRRCRLPERASHRRPDPRNGPNVVMLVADTLRADHLGYHGYTRDTSPHLDALAEDSLVFNHAIAPAPWTTPSMAGVLTGLPPRALGIMWEPTGLPAEALTLTEIVRHEGYTTAGIVSHFYIGRKFNFHRGFQFWDEAAAGGHEDISSPWVTGMALECLDALAERQEPFFLFAHYFDPHYEYLKHDTYPFFDETDSATLDRLGSFEELRQQAEEGRLSTEALDHLRARYDSEVAFTDEHVGKLIGRLKELGLYESTVVVFLADHGELFAERERWIGHTKYLYEEIVHVPLLIKLPSGRERGHIQTTVSTRAVLPMLLQELKIESPTLLKQLGEAPLPVEDHPDQEHFVYTETRRWRGSDAVYRQGWKLLFDHDTNRHRLFNLEQDPQEKVDRSHEQPELLRSLRLELERWQGSVDEMKKDFTTDDRRRARAAACSRLRRLAALAHLTHRRLRAGRHGG